MKIFILADRMESGGAETHIYELSRFLFQKGHFVTVFSQGGNIADALDAQGIRQITYHANPLLTLAHYIRKEKPTVVHAHTRKSAFLCGLLLSYMHFPFVFTAHAHFSTEPLRRTFSFFPRRIIAVSHDIAHHLTKSFRVPTKNIRIIGNGIDTDLFCPKRENVSKNHIVTVSRLDADCALTATLLCHIAPILAERLEGLCITIIGGGSELDRVRRLAKHANATIGKETVRVIGQRQNVIPYLQKASLFVGVSRAALEAMSCGVPVILSGDEGYLGLASGNTLKIAEANNFCARGYPKPTSNRLKRDIVLALSNQSIAKNAACESRHHVISYHTTGQMVNQTLEVYQAAIADTFRERRSDILLCGYYGYGNLGDELTLHAITNRLSAISQSLSPAWSESPTHKTPHLAVMTPRGCPYDGLASVNRLCPFSILDAIRNTGLFVLGGGSLLQNKTSNRSLFYYLLLLETAHLFGIPTMLYACGIGPIHADLPYALCKHALRHADLITVRDADSFALLRRMGVDNKLFLSADPVLFCQLPKAKSKGYVLAFVREQEEMPLFERLKKVNKPILLSLMDKGSDLAVTRRLARRLKRCGKQITLMEDASAPRVIELIRGADLVISARLHALILSFCIGVPFLGLSDDPKVTAFCHMAYKGLEAHPSRANISVHFRQKRQMLLTLAADDAKRALALSYRDASFAKGIDKKQEK